MPKSGPPRVAATTRRSAADPAVAAAEGEAEQQRWDPAFQQLADVATSNDASLDAGYKTRVLLRHAKVLKLARTRTKPMTYAAIAQQLSGSGFTVSAQIVGAVCRRLAARKWKGVD